MPKARTLAKEVPNGDAKSRTRDAILEAAIFLFGEKGYDGTGLQEIVAKASVSKGAFYYHFESKSDLLRHIHDRFLDHMFVVIDRISKEQESAIDVLEALIRELLVTVARFQPEVAIFVREGRFLEGEIFEEVRRKRDEFTDKLVAILRDGAERGELKRVAHPRALAFGIVGQCSWAYSWYRPESGPMEPIADMYCETILRGLRATPD